MKDLKYFIIKLILSAIVLTIAFIYLEKKPPVTAINFEVNNKADTSTNVPSQLKWHDHFKGIENLPSKPKENN
ncbi:hypothetical protein AVENP_0856 [Arcobacter venerupis]|jgi:hypothetical protein|uniref:Uncharacterized protein n=1 Tax=Arcobacter venerupis TaxID=1054033 RepID=A0AAE7E477_9BACT|nr:hypothetical protein [Arcobacter venerupis]QKF66416.1 hypothetical protein AVENP_0856 [Arcobacter venerupis]RWS50806.1 hypothetical protein CKA56_00265 [Arcobacter venerupis]